jgi:hypothetical protein
MSRQRLPAVPVRADQSEAADADSAAEEAGDLAAAGGGRGNGRGGAAYNGWTTRQLPVGTGMVDFSVAARALKAINFDGPTDCQPE